MSSKLTFEGVHPRVNRSSSSMGQEALIGIITVPCCREYWRHITVHPDGSTSGSRIIIM